MYVYRYITAVYYSYIIMYTGISGRYIIIIIYLQVYQEGIHKAYEDGGRYDQLSKRACDAERERDELKVKLVSLDAELKRTEMR